MLRLEQITALVLAAGLAIPSYWFFWTLAGGGGYERRRNPNEAVIESTQIKPEEKNLQPSSSFN